MYTHDASVENAMSREMIDKIDDSYVIYYYIFFIILPVFKSSLLL